MKRGLSSGGVSSWLIKVCLRPKRAKNVTAWAILVGMVLVIGEVDFLSGIEVSLAVFYLVPITLATGWMGPRVGVTILCLSAIARVAGDAMIVYPHPLPIHTYWNVFATTAISLFIIWLVDALLAFHRDLETKVADRTAALQDAVLQRERLEREILDTGARERSAIGRELHDELGQHLTATALASKSLAQQLGAGHQGNQAQAIVGWLEEATLKARKLARGLLLAYIEPDRLAQELNELALASSHGPTGVRFKSSGRGVRADGSQCAQIYRIAQEAIANALRHSEAEIIDVTLASDETALCLVVADNGRGFVRPERSVADWGVGLRIMEHRATVIGASFSIVSSPSRGTEVICRLPTPSSLPP